MFFKQFHREFLKRIRITYRKFSGNYIKNKALLVSHCIFGEYIVKLERLHVINAVIVLIKVCLYQSNKTTVVNTINEVFNYGTNLISILSQYKKI